jgi:hypothetical protein
MSALGRYVVGAKSIEHTIESSCIDCSAAVMLPYGLSVDARVLCAECAAGKLEDLDDYEQRLENERDQAESNGEQLVEAHTEIGDLKEQLGRLDEKARALAEALATEPPLYVATVGDRRHIVIEREPEPREGVFYGKVIARHTTLSRAVRAYYAAAKGQRP